MKKLKVLLKSNILLIAVIAYLLWSKGDVWFSHWQLEGKLASLPLTVLSLEGQNVQLPLEDRVPFVLVFWATWCGPCTLELDRYAEAIERKEFDVNQFYAVSIGEDVNLVKRVAQERKYPFKVYADPGALTGDQFNVKATPTTIHVDGSGKVDWATSGLSMTAVSRARRFLNN